MTAQSPVVTFDGTTYTLTLFRNKTSKKITFGDNYVPTVLVALEADVDPWLRSKIDGASEDGLLYYLKAELNKKGVDFYEWLSGKEEALSVLKAIHKAQMQGEIHDCGWCVNKFEDDIEALAPCSACGKPDWLCDESHHVENFP
jgi:hypothetical protein